MRKHFLFMTFFFLLGNYEAFSQMAAPSNSKSKYSLKSIKPPGGASGLYSNNLPYDCPSLLSQNWVYPTGQVYAFCNEAEIACLRQGLIKNQVEAAENVDEGLMQDLVMAERESSFKISGCRFAIQEGATGESFVQSQQHSAKSHMLKEKTQNQ